MNDGRLSPDGRSLTIQVPMMFKTRGGRKLVISPDGVPSWANRQTRVDNTMVKALARAFRWRKLMETGAYITIEEIAAAENINPSYISRVLRMTLLAPAIVEMIVDGRQPAEMTMAKVMKPFPFDWKDQIFRFGLRNGYEGNRLLYDTRNTVKAEDTRTTGESPPPRPGEEQ